MKPVFAGIALSPISAIKPTQQILKPIGKGPGDNLTVRIYMECRHQVSNTLLYHLSTSALVDENWCSSVLALSVHNLLIWICCLLLIIKIPGIRGVRLDFLLSDWYLEGGSRSYERSSSRKEAWIIFIDWWVRIIPPALTSAMFSGCFLFGFFFVIEDVVLILWGIPHREDRIRYYETRRSEGSTSWWIERSSPQKRELFSVKGFRRCSYEETYEAWKVEQEESCYLVMAWYWRSRIFRGKGEEKRQFNANANHLENDVYRNANYAKQKQNRCRLVYNY